MERETPLEWLKEALDVLEEALFLTGVPDDCRIKMQGARDCIEYALPAVEQSLLIASAVEPHLPAVRAAIVPGSPPGGRSTFEPELTQTGRALVEALGPIARADAQRRK